MEFNENSLHYKYQVPWWKLIKKGIKFLEITIIQEFSKYVKFNIVNRMKLLPLLPYLKIIITFLSQWYLQSFECILAKWVFHKCTRMQKYSNGVFENFCCSKNKRRGNHLNFYVSFMKLINHWKKCNFFLEL